MPTTSDLHRKAETIHIPVGVTLTGDLSIPSSAQGLILFAHGSGSSRKSPRNKHVAEQLQAGGFATLLFDLLTTDEEHADMRSGVFRFDVSMLAARLVNTTDWIRHREETSSFPIAYFGASTGAAAALIAAAARPTAVRAVVSRGGRPDLAGSYLTGVKAPTLLIVGGKDTPVIEMNRSALRQIGSLTKELVIVPGATHLFEEPGTLDRVANLALDWFRRHLIQKTVPMSGSRPPVW